jgi:hypothetical protein
MVLALHNRTADVVIRMAVVHFCHSSSIIRLRFRRRQRQGVSSKNPPPLSRALTAVPWATYLRNPVLFAEAFLPEYNQQAVKNRLLLLLHRSCALFIAAYHEPYVLIVIFTTDVSLLRTCGTANSFLLHERGILLRKMNV